MTSNQPPDRRRSVLLLGLVGLLLTSGCLASVGAPIDDPRTVAQQVEMRYDALDEYQTTIDRTVVVGDTTATTRATVRFVKGEALWITHHTGPKSGTVAVIHDPSPSKLLSTDAAATETTAAETSASYGAFAAHLVRTNNVTYRGTTVLRNRPAVVLSLEPSTNETADRLTERQVWIDSERRVPLRIESVWQRDGEEITETIRFTNTSLSTTNASGADGGVTA